MRSAANRWHTFAFRSLALAVLLASAPALLRAQGGEPRYYAIRGAKVVPVSGPPLENATILIARGVITAVGKDLTIPDEAWIIDGTGLTVYPGLFDAYTDVGLSGATPPPSAGGESGGGRQSESGLCAGEISSKR